MIDERPDAHRVELIEDRWATIRHAVEAIAIVAAGVWSFYVVIYEERIKPAHTIPSAVITVRVESQGVRRGVEFVRLAFDVHNTGGTQIDVIADRLQLVGKRLAPPARQSHGTSPEGSVDRADVPLTTVARVLDVMDLRDRAGGQAGLRWTLNSGESSSETVLVAVPHGRFDVVTGVADVIYQRADSPLLRVGRVPSRRGQLTFSGASPDTVYDTSSASLVLAP